MLRLTETIRNRRMPRRESETTETSGTRLAQSRPRDVARLYTPRIWL